MRKSSYSLRTHKASSVRGPLDVVQANNLDVVVKDERLVALRHVSRLLLADDLKDQKWSQAGS